LKAERYKNLPEHTLLISKDGIERFLEDSAAPIIQENGEMLVWVVVFQRFFPEKEIGRKKLNF